MFRSFLSWRYLVSRRSNLIGIVGILIAVGALILILSIMTGFLEEQRSSLRGTLSDVMIRPYQGPTPGIALRRPAASDVLITGNEPEALPRAIRRAERIRKASRWLLGAMWLPQAAAAAGAVLTGAVWVALPAAAFGLAAAVAVTVSVRKTEAG